MDIETALEKLGAFITDMLDRGAINSRELGEIEEVEDAIHAYVCGKGDL